MLRYLAERGISPGERFVVRDRQPFGGPLFVQFGEREHAIGGQLAGAMRVELERSARSRCAGRARGGAAMAPAEALASSRLLAPPPLTDEDAARSHDRARVHDARAGTASAGICCGCSSVPGSSRCSARTTGRA